MSAERSVLEEPRTTPGGRPRLIVNADDFGRSSSINRAILRAHHDGILTSCSLMVGGEALEEAVRGAGERPTLAVGLHLTALWGHPVLAEAPWSPLVARGGAFSRRPVVAGMACYFLPSARRLLRREIEAQFRRFAETGLPLSHVDGHLHFHVHPVIFDTALREAVRYGAAGLRVPRDDLRLDLRLGREGLAAKAMLAAVFAAVNRRCLRRARRLPLRIPDRSLGLFRSERMDEEHLCGILRLLPPGLSEVYLHPDDGGRGQAGTLELAALLSPRVRRVLGELGAVLTTYARG